jgi:hypothetical protein
MNQSDFEVEDQSLMQSIFKDIARTLRHIATLPSLPVQNTQLDTPRDYYSEHMRRLERILYVLGKRDTKMLYMQGFNELLMMIYYVFFKAGDIIGSVFEHEAFSFFVLNQLLSKTKLLELYNTKDASSTILSSLNCFSDILQFHLPQFAQKLQTLNILPIHYSYRWFCVLFVQSFDMTQLIQI